MDICYLGIGSNIGKREEYIERAIAMLRDAEGIEVRRISSIYETEPVGDVPQGKFLNGVVEIATGIPPRALLRTLNDIEARLGRVRSVAGGPRTIDLDILYYGKRTVDEPGLRIPHPRIEEREFVLRGLRELGRA